MSGSCLECAVVDVHNNCAKLVNHCLGNVSVNLDLDAFCALRVNHIRCAESEKLDLRTSATDSDKNCAAKAEDVNQNVDSCQNKTNTCSNMIEPYEVTISEAVRQGFEPCKRCYG